MSTESAHSPLAQSPPASSAGEHFGASPFEAGHTNLEFLKKSLPAWYISASKALREALRLSQLKNESSRRTLEPIRSRLVSIENFATPLLEQALLDRFKLRLDVTANQLVTMEVTTLLLVQTLKPVKQTLLHAALQNFEASESVEGGLGQGAALLPAEGLQVELIYGSGLLPDVPRFRYRYDGTLDIKPEQFAGLSRTLDLGARYQMHLDSVFKPVTPQGQAPGSAAQAVADAFMRSERDAVEVLAHIARMKEHISADSYQLLLELVKPDGKPRWHGRPVRYRQLHMLDTYAFPGSTLYGALLIEADQPGDDLPCVVYLPGDPETPLKEYASFEAFTEVMCRKLFNMKYQEYFQRFVSLEQSHVFFHKLNERLTPLRPLPGDESLLAPKFDANAELYLQKRAIDKPPFEALYDHLLTKTYADSRIVAVPTRDEDRKSRLKRWNAFESAGMDLLMVAGFFVPVLGAMLAVVAVGQLLHEAFVAVEDWTHGETEEALNHVFDIGENLAAMAVLGAAVHVAPRVLPSSFVESLTAVKLPNGLTRLWKPDLARFRQKVVLPSRAAADAQGLIKVDGKTWLPLAGELFRVEFDTALNKWRVQHPDDLQSHSPVLEHNGAGAWRFEGENPMGWDETFAFKRLNASHDVLTDETVGQLLRTTGVDDGVLRQVHVDNLGSPALLSDAVHRFSADQQVQAFIAKVATEPDRVTAPHIEPFLKLLTSMPRWPEKVALRLLDEQGAVLETWNAHSGVHSVIHATYTPGSMTTLLEAVLDGLSSQEAETLLGERIDAKEEKVLGLARLFSEQAQASSGRVRDDIHALQSVSSDPLVRLIRRDFPALPEVVCRELLGTAMPAQQTRMLSARRVPLPIAEEAREYLQQLRLNRANEGFFLHTADNPDTVTAGFKLLPGLSGWPAGMAVEMRNATFTGTLLDSVGDISNADVRSILTRTETGYQAFDSHGNALGQAGQSFFTALLDALPHPVLRDIGFPDGVGEQMLRARLGDLAVQQRESVARMLGMQAIKPGFKWPQRLADGRTGYPMSGRLRGLFRRMGIGSSSYSPELAVKNLYPTFTEDETRSFLDRLKARYAGPAEQFQAFVRGRLDGLAVEYKTLEQQLEQWSESRHIPANTRDARRVAAFRLRNCWRHTGDRVYMENSVDFAYKLVLNDLPIGELPPLSGNWSHVGALELKRLSLHAAEIDAFLAHFKGAFWVSLRDNNLTTVPVAVTQMTHLERLSLAENPLVLDESSALRLNGCTELRALDLGDCPVGDQLHRLRPFFLLRSLNLRAADIETLPAWIWRCARLRYLDLRHNRIAELNEVTLRNLVQPGLEAQLHDNPLNEPSLTRARRLLTGEELRRMGIDAARTHIDEPLPPVTLWLTGIPAGELQGRLLKWSDLEAEPDAAEFFRVLNELRASADFATDRAMLTRRVWALVDVASETTELREELFEMAAHPVTCGDGVAIVFSNLETHAQVFRIKTTVSADDQPERVFRLVRGLERLDEVEKHALRLITLRRSAEVSVDEAEIRLAFRVGLARTLDLPNQPEGMLYNRLAGVTQEMLDDVYAQILGKESTPQFLQALIAREFWMTFLEQRYAQDFEPLKAFFQDRMGALDNNRSDLTDEHYLAQIDTIQRERSEALDALACKLSLDIQVAVVREELAGLSTD
ncbi:NEL-type E3 ubiquitin ligase domain-containing protein [Pseudomonas sp. G.S.17]|uniref:NEL-type E3 ubiquitin ligase domain-containing protein n=1 Tax=Pseudomonas sp. G.S.17 TaxID=3137451 RepID=UPI00311CC3C3